jgi:hypothetical protein
MYSNLPKVTQISQAMIGKVTQYFSDCSRRTKISNVIYLSQFSILALVLYTPLILNANIEQESPYMSDIEQAQLSLSFQYRDYVNNTMCMLYLGKTLGLGISRFLSAIHICVTKCPFRMHHESCPHASSESGSDRLQPVPCR